MPLLPLALEIAEIVTKAGGTEAPLDAVTTAEHLVAAHPEAEVSKADIRDAVICVASDAGVPTEVS
jgi:hypothetical protein